MNPIEPESPNRSLTLHITMPDVGQLPEPLASAFAHCSAEAQMLERAIKSAIKKDVHVFAPTGDQISFLEILEKITLGQAKDIAIGTASRHSQKEIAACIGFFDCVKVQWGFTGRPELELSRDFKDAVERRNRLAHGLLAEVLHSEVSVPDALTFMKESSERFLKLRSLVVTSDELSSKMGSIATDGSSLPRSKITY